ncbi:hypothetical protein Efla_003337 [Eimeria flavescens]
MRLQGQAEEAKAATEAGGAMELLSSVSSSLQHLQCLLEEGDFEEINRIFFRMHNDDPRKSVQLQRSGGPVSDAQILRGPRGPSPLYPGGPPRPSSASTAVPSSSLSLCAASLEAPDPGNAKGPQRPPACCDCGKGAPPLSSSGAEGASGAPKEGKLEAGSSHYAPAAAAAAAREERHREAAAATSSSNSNSSNRSSSNSTSSNSSSSGFVQSEGLFSFAAATPRKEAAAAAAGREREKAKGRAKPAASASAFLARRSPRLQKATTGQSCVQQEAAASCASRKQQQQQQQQQQAWGSSSAWGASSAAADRGGRALAVGGKRRQGAAVAASSAAFKRQKEGGGPSEGTPRSTRMQQLQQQQQQSCGDAEATSSSRRGAGGPLSPQKGSHPQQRKGGLAKTAWAAVQARRTAASQKKAGLSKEEQQAEGEAARRQQTAHRAEEEEEEEDPICHFALPVRKTEREAPSASESSSIAAAAAQLQEARAGGSRCGCQEAHPAREEGGPPPAQGALRHKVLRPLPEPTQQFDFGLFIVRAAALSKHADDIFPLLEDEELMERSAVLQRYLDPPKEKTQRRADHFRLDKLVADIPTQDGAYRPFQDIEEAPWCRGLEGGQEVLSKKEVLRQRIEMQKKWNPFSIFGSSPPSVELEDVFGFEVYQKTAPSARVHHPLFRRLSQFQSFKDLYSSLSKQEWDSVSSAFRHHWNQQCRLDLDWRNDPLTVDETMWMLEANEQVEDRSSDVYEAEICYCVTPNPNIGFGWNDPRCHRYKSGNLIVLSLD